MSGLPERNVIAIPVEDGLDATDVVLALPPGGANLKAAPAPSLLRAVRGQHYALDPAYDIDPTGATDCAAGFALLDAAAGDDGVRVIPEGTYKIASTVTFSGPVLADPGAVFSYTGSGTALKVRRGTGATRIWKQTIRLPRVVKAVKAWASDIGVELRNLTDCEVAIPYVNNFGVGLLITAEGVMGTAYNEFIIGHLDNNKVGLKLSPSDSSSWVNENTYAGPGHISQNSDEGTAVSGARHIQIDAATNLVNNNLFLRLSLEGNVPEFHVQCSGTQNWFAFCRWEATTPKVDLPTATSDGNVILYGYNAAGIVFTDHASASGNHLYSQGGQRIVGFSANGVLVGENATSNANPVFAALPAASGLSADPATDWGWQAGQNATKAKATADTDYRWQLAHSTGVATWGDGAGVKDVNLYRNGADILKTDDQFQAALGVTIGGGTKVAKVLSTAGALNFPNVVAHTAQELTMTLTGALATTASLALANPLSGTIEAGLTWNAYVSAADTVTVRVANITGSDIDPANQNWRVTVLQF